MVVERLKEIKRQVKQLQEAGFIKEIRYTTWLANVILVKKIEQKMENVC